MPGPEATYQRNLMLRLRDRGAYVVKYPAGPHGTVGTPDLLICYRGRFIALELKAGDPNLAKYAPTTMQLQQLQAVRNAGGIAFVAHPGINALAILDDLDLLFDAILDE
jgi:Holliday junction resolvase